MLAAIWPFGKAAGLQIERDRNNTAMSSFRKRKRIVIGNDRAWKAIVRNYYVENDFRKAKGINHNFDCLIV